MSKYTFIMTEDGSKIAVDMQNIKEVEDVFQSKVLPVSSPVDNTPRWESFVESVETIANSVQKAIEKIRPDKTTVEIGLDFAMSTNGLVAAIVKGSTNASIKLILEWENVKNESE